MEAGGEMTPGVPVFGPAATEAAFMLLERDAPNLPKRSHP